MITEDLLRPDWPAAPTVIERVTTRVLPGIWQHPCDAFNLGSNCGDAPNAVRHNRRRLIELAGLPATAHPPSSR